MMWKKLEQKLKEIDSSSDFLDGMYTYLNTEENYKKMYDVIVEDNITDADTAIYKMIEIVYGKDMVNWNVINAFEK